MIRRFVMLLPPPGVLIAVVFGMLLLHLPALLSIHRFGVAPPPQALVARGVGFVAGAILYGVYRVAAFHPFYQGEYRKWLETTPWTWRKPLPVGPIHLVWEDALIAAILFGVGWFEGDVLPLATLSLLLGGYLVALSPTCSTTGAGGFQYAILFLVGLGLRLWQQPAWAYAGALIGAYMLGMVALGRSLKRWPWGPVIEFDTKKLEKAFQTPATEAPTDLGWPFDRLGPRPIPDLGPLRSLNILAQCLTTGWLFYAVLGLITDPNGRLGLGGMAIGYVTLFGVIMRLRLDLKGYVPPISLLGRLTRLRPISFSYDQVFLAPATAIIVASIGPATLHRAGLEWDGAEAITLSLVLIALRLGGPDRHRWQLTARHRIVPALTSNAASPFIRTG